MFHAYVMWSNLSLSQRILNTKAIPTYNKQSKTFQGTARSGLNQSSTNDQPET